MTEAICEALQKVRILQVGEVSHGCHQRRPQHLLWPRAGAMHAAEDYHHGDQCVLVIDRLQIARKRRVQGIVQNSGKWRGRQGEAWKMVFEVKLISWRLVNSDELDAVRSRLMGCTVSGTYLHSWMLRLRYIMSRTHSTQSTSKVKAVSRSESWEVTFTSTSSRISRARTPSGRPQKSSCRCLFAVSCVTPGH